MQASARWATAHPSMTPMIYVAAPAGWQSSRQAQLPQLDGGHPSDRVSEQDPDHSRASDPHPPR